MLKELKLTKKQDAPFHKIFAKYRQDVVEWSRKNVPEMEDIQKRIKTVHDGKNTESVKV